MESAVDKERAKRPHRRMVYPEQKIAELIVSNAAFRAEMAALRATLAERDAALKRIAGNAMLSEMSQGLYEDINFEVVYDEFVAIARAALSYQPQRREEAKGDFGSPSGLKNHLVSKIDRALHDAQELEMPAQAKELVSQAHVDLHDLAGLLSDDAEIRASLSAAISDQPQHQGDGR